MKDYNLNGQDTELTMAHARSDGLNEMDNAGYLGDTNGQTDGAVLKSYKPSGENSYHPTEETAMNGQTSQTPATTRSEKRVTYKPGKSPSDPDIEVMQEPSKQNGVNHSGDTPNTIAVKNGPAPILKQSHSGGPARASIVSFKTEPTEIEPKEGDRGDEEEEKEEEEEEDEKRDVEEDQTSKSEVDVRITMPTMTPEEIEQTLINVRRRFSKYADTANCISEGAFLEALGENKDSFFAERFFRFLDKDRNGSLDMDEITEGARILLSGTTAQKVAFVFTLYDTDGNGQIEREELNQVLTSCVLESKMKLNESEIALLSNTMFDEADKDKDGYMSEKDLAALVNQFPNAMEALTKNASIWLQPDLRQQNAGKSRLREFFSKRNLTNNAKKISFLALFYVLNVVLFAVNAYIYRKSNNWIIFARGCGMCLNFTSALILLLPLRMCLSYLRLTPFQHVLPLDHNISIHKQVGLVIAFWMVGHTVGHLGNAVWITEHTNLTVPEILFTTKAHLGWIGHLAPLTGVILDIILIIMVVASRPFVRRSGYFQAFYWTHKLYIPYYILTFIHAPNFWKWMVVPATIFVVETIMAYLRSRGGTMITQVSLLPSAVTQLVIRKPPGFKFKPGDYVFIKIPIIAKYEWHPFTISSAPEQEDTFWVHIRSVGNWTKQLRQHLVTHYSPKKNSASSNTFAAKAKRRASSVAWFSRRTSMALAKEASIKKRTITKDTNIQVFVDGPYGSPCREIFDTEHAILIGAGIGATPFASILQSITYRFKAGLVTCPKCLYSWCHAPRNLMNLKKVDFVWINRDQSNFEWFSSLICNIEKEQSKESSLKDAISMHMFMTAAPNQYEVNGVGVQMALDLVHNAKKTDLLTGLSTRTQGGRPDFDKLFAEIKRRSVHSKIKVFFCGSPVLGNTIQRAALEYGIAFSKEHF